MAESDDEYDRKRRDKFRGERSAGENYARSDRRDDRARPPGRDDWGADNRARVRAAPDYRDYRPIRERGYSPGREGPPMKRMRGDWGDEGRQRFGGHEGGYGMYGYAPPDPGYMHASYAYAAPLTHARDSQLASDQTQPCMMTLKNFLATQDDSISDSEAIQKYSDYKLEFKRQQLNEFFVAHKDEEWFKIKYHPEESLKRREEQLSFLKKRVDVFLELLDDGDITKVSVDTTNTDQLLRLLDTVVIKLEGGTEEDLKALDEKPQVEMIIKMAPEKPKVEEPPEKEEEIEFTGRGLQSQDEEMWDDEEPAKPIEPPPKETTNEDDDDGEKEDEGEDTSEKEHRKRKRSNSGSSSSSSSSSSSDSEDEDKKENEKKDDNEDEEEIPKTPVESEPLATKEDTNEEELENKNENQDKVEKMENEESADDDVADDNPEEDKEKNDQNEGEIENDEEEEEEGKEGGQKKEEENKPETIDLVQETPEVEPPRALHKTSSIFLRNLAPSITKAEVEAMCKRYNGFLRVAIADPLLERRWFRRGWVTFQREVNIKEICWNLNNIRLRDCELGAIVNRDLSRRVRPVNGITSHKTIVRSDIKLIAKIAHNLDDKTGLWKDGPINKEQNGSTFGLQSKNPVLQNITDYLIEEASAEEEELLGLSTEGKDNIDGEFIDRDPQLITVLDKLIMYLRIVHSVDFYNHCEYPYEDEMPNRCGIIHARGPIPQNRVTQTEIQDYIRTFEGKMQSFLTQCAEVELDEMKKIGAKDIDAEVEKFIAANTQELAKDKWLCPLSGKKFKGPDFVRKHIFNKHGEKVDEVKKEVEYFNNYLKDPKRPQLPEHPGNTKKLGSDGPQAPAGRNFRYRPPYGGPAGYPPAYGGYAPMMAPRPRPAPYSMGRGRIPAQDYRPVIHYRDLDAPASDEYL